MHNAALRGGTNPFTFGTPAQEDAFTSRRDEISPAPASVQRAVAALKREDVVERLADRSWAIAEPCLDAWLDRGVGEA